MPALMVRVFQTIQDIEIEQPWSVGESRDRLAFDRNPVLIDLVEKRFTERDGVSVTANGWATVAVDMVVPKLGAIKKMESRPIEDWGHGFCFLSSEQDGGSKDPLKAVDETPVVKAVFRKLEEFEDFGGALEMDGATLLFHGEGCDPDRNETILTERQTEVWVSRHLKDELAIPAAMDQLASGRPTERDAAKDEWPGIEPELLFCLVALFSNQGDGIQLLQTLLGNREAIKNRLNGGKARVS